MKKIVQLFTVSMSIGFLEGLPELLKQNGYELIVISADGPEAREGEKQNAFRFYPVEMARGISPKQNLKAWLEVRKILKAEKPDIVHGNTPIGGLIALSAAWSLGIKNRVFTLHGLKYPGEKGIKKFIIKQMEKLSIRLSKKSFAVSEGLRQYVCDEKIAKGNMISVLNHGSVKGIDVEKSKSIRDNGREYYERKLNLQNGCFRFGYFGRINEEKGIPELLKAFHILEKSGCSLEAIICGSNELTVPENNKAFEEFIQKGNINYCSWVSNPLDYMMCCDCIVLPTHREGFGLVNIEANSLGIPAITTDVMGCKDSIADNKTGLFFHTGNPDDLAKKMQYIYNHSEEREKMGAAGIERSEQLFNRVDIWAKLIEEYDKLTGGKI